MSHATYGFLLDYDPTWNEEEAKDEALAAFRVFNDQHCDENNWSSPMGLVLPSGKVLNVNEPVKLEPGDKGDWRGRDTFADNFQKDVPAKDKLKAAIRFAAGCSAVDAEILEDVRKWSLGEPTEKEKKADKALNSMTTGDLGEACVRVLTERLVAFENGKWKKDKRFKYVIEMKGEHQDDHLKYLKKKAAQALAAIHSCPAFPFAEAGSPYDYRNFDLRNEGYGKIDMKKVMVLFVDIHT